VSDKPGGEPLRPLVGAVGRRKAREAGQRPVSPESRAPFASDFTYDFFCKLLQAAGTNFDIHRVGDAPRILDRDGLPKLILRHDVDLDLDSALRMAEIEHEMRVRATYLVMLNSPLYRVDDAASKAKLARLLELGHEVGLHFDIDDPDESNPDLDVAVVEKPIRAAADRLEKVIRRPVESVSFHRPIRQLLRGPLRVAGLVNAYSARLMSWYLSDSKGSWREGDPFPMLLDPPHPLLQLLIHPFWWDREHRRAEQRLEELFTRATRGMSPAEIEALDAALAGHLSIWRPRVRAERITT